MEWEKKVSNFLDTQGFTFLSLEAGLAFFKDDTGQIRCLNELVMNQFMVDYYETN